MAFWTDPTIIKAKEFVNGVLQRYNFTEPDKKKIALKFLDAVGIGMDEVAANKVPNADKSKEILELKFDPKLTMPELESLLSKLGKVLGYIAGAMTKNPRMATLHIDVFLKIIRLLADIYPSLYTALVRENLNVWDGLHARELEFFEKGGLPGYKQAMENRKIFLGSLP